MVTDMAIEIEAARALTYETARLCDHERNNLRVLEFNKDLEKEDKRARKKRSRKLKRMNSMLTPMSKYYCSEMSIRVADTCIQVLGGSGYMKDYAAERHLRDARITTIYEGTSQLQVVAAVRGISSGTLNSWAEEHEARTYDDPMLEQLKQSLIDGKKRITEAVEFVKTHGASYLDLSGRRLVDSGIAVLIGHLLLVQGTKNDRKKRVAKRFIERQMNKLEMNCREVLSGDTSALEEYALLAGPVPGI
jgi:hypothetical protein